MGGGNYSMFAPSKQLKRLKDPKNFFKVSSGKAGLEDLDEMMKAPEPIPAPELPPPVAAPTIDESAAGDMETRNARKRRGYSSTVLTGALVPKTKKGRTALG